MAQQQQNKRQYECFVCKKNNFPGTMVLLGGRDSAGKTIYIETDGSTAHTHKHEYKAAPMSDENMQIVQQAKAQQQKQMAQQTTQAQVKSKDEQIAEYHIENREDRVAYRALLKEQVEATKQLAESNRQVALALGDVALALGADLAHAIEAHGGGIGSNNITIPSTSTNNNRGLEE
jgi:hypothetical protein